MFLVQFMSLKRISSSFTDEDDCCSRACMNEEPMLTHYKHGSSLLDMVVIWAMDLL